MAKVVWDLQRLSTDAEIEQYCQDDGVRIAIEPNRPYIDSLRLELGYISGSRDFSAAVGNCARYEPSISPNARLRILLFCLYINTDPEGN
jgi:hypothetical protein